MSIYYVILKAKSKFIYGKHLYFYFITKKNLVWIQSYNIIVK